MIHGRLTLDQKFALHVQLAEWYEKKEKSIVHLAYHWTEVVEGTKGPSMDLIHKCVRYLHACGELASKNNRSDAWKWYHKAATIVKKYSDEMKNPMKTIGILGTATNMQEWNIAIPPPSDNEIIENIDIRVLCGISGTHSPFGSK